MLILLCKVASSIPLEPQTSYFYPNQTHGLASSPSRDLLDLRDIILLMVSLAQKRQLEVVLELILVLWLLAMPSLQRWLHTLHANHSAHSHHQNTQKARATEHHPLGTSIFHRSGTLIAKD